jgi:hypothetical protein
MRRIALIGAALIASLAMNASASARIGIGMAPVAAEEGSVIQVNHMRGHRNWHRGRGHHRGWSRGRGHWRR